jgi:GxxExxY protein
MTEYEIGTKIVETAIAVHRALGPGLLETGYEVVLAHALQEEGLREKRRKALISRTFLLSHQKIGYSRKATEVMTK